MSKKEIQPCDYITLYPNTYTDEQDMFTSSEILELKTREAALIERNETGYYCCKKRHADLYMKLKAAYAPYITREHPKMLNHSWNTHTKRINEYRCCILHTQERHILHDRFFGN